MNNTHSLEKISQTGNHDATLILRLYKVDLKSRFMDNKFNDPNLTQKQRAHHLGYLHSTIKTYRNRIVMPSP